MQELQNHEPQAEVWKRLSVTIPQPPPTLAQDCPGPLAPAAPRVLAGQGVVAPAPRMPCTSLGPMCEDRRALAEGRCMPGAMPTGHLLWLPTTPPAPGLYSATTIMHGRMIRVEAKRAGAEMYLASFPLAGHRGPWLPWCARQSSCHSDQSQSRWGA